MLARVFATRAVDSVELVWHDVAAAQPAVRMPMVLDELGLWHASIPGAGYGARIAWHVEANDEDGDRGFFPPSASNGAGCGAEFCFSILPPP